MRKFIIIGSSGGQAGGGGGYVETLSTGPSGGRQVKFLESPLLSIQIKEAAKNLLKGSRKLTKYTTEYYKKYRSLTQTEKLRDYVLQHSQRQHRHHYRSHGRSHHHHHDSSHRHHKDGSSHDHQRAHRDTTHGHNQDQPSSLQHEAPQSPKDSSTYDRCCCMKRLTDPAQINTQTCHEFNKLVRGCTYESHRKLFPTKSDPCPKSVQYKSYNQTVCDYAHCPLQYFSEPHLYTEVCQPSNLLEAQVSTSRSKDSRHVHFLNPLHTSAPNLGQCDRVTRVLPLTPQEKIYALPDAKVFDQQQCHLAVPPHTASSKRHSKCVSLSVSLSIYIYLSLSRTQSATLEMYLVEQKPLKLPSSLFADASFLQQARC